MHVKPNHFSPRRFLLLMTLTAAFVWMADGLKFAAAEPDDDVNTTEIDAVFSPDGGCARRIISEIESAQRAINVQAYIFTSDRIADALIEAAERNIKVRVIFDSKQKKQRYSKWKRLRQGGVKVLFDGEHSTANNKIMLIDNRTIITGSYNYSKAAESRNAENIVIIRNDRRLFKKYRQNFEAHLEHSK